MGPTVRAALGYASGGGAAGTVPAAVVDLGGKGAQDDVPHEADPARSRP